MNTDLEVRSLNKQAFFAARHRGSSRLGWRVAIRMKQRGLGWRAAIRIKMMDCPREWHPCRIP